MAEQRKSPKNSRKTNLFQLALLFAAMVFLLLLLTMTTMFAGFLLFHYLDFQGVDEIYRVPLFTFALISTVLGTLLAFLFGKLPMKPILRICEASDRIAAGDYSVRLDLKGPEQFVQLSDSFNHMAAELDSVEVLRSDFVNSFSHEFKTPIVSIRGFAKMLKRDDLTPEEREEYLDTIIAESDRLAELSTNVLNLTKIEQQTILTGKTELNLSEELRLAIALLAEKWQEKQLSFDFDCGEVYLTGNRELLKQVWINLLDNAIKFSPAGETISIRLQRTVSSVIVSISNKSAPLGEEELRHLFDKFYQADRSHATRGSGLGLAIVKRIVELHSGSVSAENGSHADVVFRVVLPNGQDAAHG